MSTQPIEEPPRQPAAPPAYSQPAPAYTGPTAVAPASRMAGAGSLAVRVVLTLLGAAGLIVGSFLAWFQSVDGTKITMRIFVAHPGTVTALLRSAGAVTILIGFLAILGLAPRTGWLTRLAGALGLVATILFVIQMFRAPGNASISDLGAGFWLVLAGAVVALIGGFFGTRHRVMVTGGPTAVATTEP
jgi:hypothetical protein